MKVFEYWEKVLEAQEKSKIEARLALMQASGVRVYSKETEMAKNTKYDWCNDRTGNIKEFLGWIYARLQSKGDNFNDSHMVKLDSFITELPGTIPEEYKMIHFKNERIKLETGDTSGLTLWIDGKKVYQHNK